MASQTSPQKDSLGHFQSKVRHPKGPERDNALTDRLFLHSETQLRSRLKKWGVTKLSRRRSQNKFIMSHCEDLSNESCFKSPVYSGDDMAHSASTSHSTTKDDFYTPERGDTMHETQTASGIIPHDSFHSSASAMSANTPSWEYHHISPGYHSRYVTSGSKMLTALLDHPRRLI
ncbi:unnamed protein product [Aspergillus oryzae]|uniref:Unnamed protein product n=2 Tax=Aspergillus oryzae TaxID=5062 RepID=A0AAN4YIC9_ASPOZ|nr:unnamed protein product [Aspergillus oryzae]GMF96312.1 unnamed protein product [Aspergillus oryzae]GMG16656.1 unnamed protein product [Aspergillus oryzae]GMG29788.1 unnamed protein product [Aspergillus oryzae]GMG48338.1 unnamed protein product [Aspergillus oryzae var. brunneus]